jgi:hypothetical protein
MSGLPGAASGVDDSRPPSATPDQPETGRSR